MRWCKTFVFLFLTAFLFTEKIYSSDRIDFPNPEGYVNDFANILTNDSEIETKLRELEESDGTQILVITTDELPKGVTLDTFIPRLTDNNPEWAAGQAENDNGVIFTIVMDDRQTRIDVGYGLEGALPDIVTKHIQDDYVKPYFQEGDYDSGVIAGVDKIIESVKGEYTVEDVESEQEFERQFESLLGELFLGIMLLLFFVLPWIGAFLGRTKSWWLGGVIGTVLGILGGLWMSQWVFLGWFRYGGFAFFPIVFGGLGLLFDYILSKNYRRRVKKGLPTGFRSSWGGFSSGGRSWGGGSSSGGFSSGGGSFGGGGSSSSW